MGEAVVYLFLGGQLFGRITQNFTVDSRERLRMNLPFESYLLAWTILSRWPRELTEVSETDRPKGFHATHGT